MIVHIITGLGTGGAEGVLYRLICHQDPAAHRIISLTDMGEYGFRFRKLGFEVDCLDMRRGKFSLRSFYHLIKILRLCKPDIVQTWMYHSDFIGGLAAYFSGCRRIFWNIRHSDIGIGSPRSTYIVARICSVLSWFIPEKIIVCSLKARDLHSKFGYCSRKLIFIPNGFDSGLFKKKNTPILADIEKDLLNGDFFVFGMVARSNKQKNHEGVLRAFSLVCEFDYKALMVFIGEMSNADQSRLFDLADDLGIRENLLILGPKNNVADYYNLFDAHVLCSTHGEGFPNVVAESMLCGVPNIVTDVGDSCTIVGETGFVVAQAEVSIANGLVLAIEEKLRNSRMWDERCNSARQRIVDNYSFQSMIKAYMEAWAA